MLRGLIVRQVFFIVDLVLMGAIGLTAVLALQAFLSGDPALPPSQHQGGSSAGGLQVAALEDRASYDSIIENRLFGEAGNRSSDAIEEAPPEPVIDRAPPTLPLKLLGTVTTAPKDPNGTAIIESSRPREGLDRVATYYIDQVVLDQISLAEIHKRSVILWNAATRKWIELPMDDETPVRAAMPMPGQRAAPQTAQLPAAPGVFNLNRDELLQDVMDASTALASMQPRIAYDDNGNALGITADGIDQLPLAQKLGFEAEDVVQQINGRTVDSLDKVYEVLQQFQGLDTVRVSVLRGGRPTMLTYRLN